MHERAREVLEALKAGAEEADGFPPYAFVPGCHPHPRRSPMGHSHGAPHPEAPGRLGASDAAEAMFLRGVTLHDAGFFWEAHELWEALWHGLERRGPTARFLQGAIQSAAAQLKILQGMPRGREILWSRADGLFRDLLAHGHEVMAGVDLRGWRGDLAAWFEGEGAEFPSLRRRLVP